MVRGRLVTGLVRWPLPSHPIMAERSYVKPSVEGGRQASDQGGWEGVRGHTCMQTALFTTPNIPEATTGSVIVS